ILFVNLLTDGLPALALGVEPASAAVMQQRPRPHGAGLVSRYSLTPILGIGGLIAVVSLLAFALGHHWEDGDLAISLTFATLVGAQLSASLAFRSETELFYRLRRNTWLVAAIAISFAAFLAVLYLPPLQE